MNIQPLKTERLVLRKIEVTDAPFFFELFNSEGWLRYIGNRNIQTVADAEKQITKKYIPSYTTNGYGSYLVIEKATQLPIGTCGIYKRDNLEYPDIGFAFLPDFTGKGFGFEAAFKVLHHSKTVLKIDTIYAFTVKENTASIGLLKKLGLQCIDTYVFPGETEKLLLFSTSKA
ncbi:GNAT family N-acetyltransferase [Marinirhabdus gelatinilytica]|uniref:RimJ/RimL family protein N-acetyltransferase n=1 Tax=Marinirhabdus gelatinilytica TaxID=1703343 RepID=A0A370QAY2_9FLAO|nr:GNAT family N-acetyltransferase [Marinirhabdus gelatinilytica]RDK85439.1 RimJ/RimL family protein N-acetyltransferase [Marinirhabdus gelatinilytica]